MRLFVALDLPADVRRALGDLIAKLKPLSRGRPVGAAGRHARYAEIYRARNCRPATWKSSTRCARRWRPFVRTSPWKCSFRGVGFFPNASRPRVIWCGVQASNNLAPLAADIETALEPLGISAEDRAFVPHLTLARFKPSRSARRRRSHPRRAKRCGLPLRRMAEREFGSSRETEFHLFESITKPGGAEYRKIETLPVRKGPA